MRTRFENLFKEYTVYLYLLQNTKLNEDFFIDACFENYGKYELQLIDEHVTTATKTSMRRAELTLYIDEENRLYHNTARYKDSVGSYILRRRYSSHSSYHMEPKERFIDGSSLIQHYFLFDVDFGDDLSDDSFSKIILKK